MQAYRAFSASLKILQVHRLESHRNTDANLVLQSVYSLHAAQMKSRGAEILTGSCRCWNVDSLVQSTSTRWRHRVNVHRI